MSQLEARLSIATLEAAAAALRALAHPLRLAIVDLLKEKGELPVKDIHGILNIEQAVVSHHLGILKNKGVLVVRPEGNKHFYAIKDEEVAQVLAYVEQCF